MKKKTLLQQAIELKPIPKGRFIITTEHKEMFKAYCREEITLTAMGEVLGYKRHSFAYPFLLAIAKEIIKNK